MVLTGDDYEAVKHLNNVDVLVIDAEYFTSAEISMLRENGIKEIYTYLNIGSIENFRSYYGEYEEYSLGEYENWPDEKWVDISRPEWQAFIINQAYELSKKNIDGFFIDNTDVYYLYNSEDIYNGIINVISGIKSTQKKIIINGGETFIRKWLESDASGTLIDGINQESIYTSYDFDKNRCIKNTDENIEYYTEYLLSAADRGLKIYVIEYADSFLIKKKAYSYSKKYNFTCYVSPNIELKITK